MDKTELHKERALRGIESLEGRIKQVSSMIHSYAEVGTKEFRSSALLCTELARHGFTIEKKLVGIPTAFKAVLKGKPGPTVALLAEYDALPEIGHGCGHNIIGTSAAFAAISLSSIIKQLRGSVVVLGTPDEEGYGGKIPMLQRGAFKGVDAVIENHPFIRNATWWPTVALGDLAIQLEGKEAHYATPHKGANALDAALAILSTLNILKHGFRSDVVLGYTLDTESATPVIVPSRARVHIAFKASDIRYLRVVANKIRQCVNGISKSMGVKVSITDAFDKNLCFEESIPNIALIEALERNFSHLGIEAEKPADSVRFRSFYSTDYGNVSMKFPGVNFAVAVAQDLSLHTCEFAKAVISRKGQEALIMATKLMAMTAIDILDNPDTLRKAKEEFQKYRANDFESVPFQPIF